MPIVVNATEETISLQIAGNWFTFKPAQRKTIRDPQIARFIEMDRRGYGLAVLPELTTQAEDDGDVELDPETLKERKSAAAENEKAVIKLAFDAYISRKREIIKNNQVSLARDLARADYKYGPEHEVSEGELEAMRIVARADKGGKDADEVRLKEVRELTKQLKGK